MNAQTSSVQNELAASVKLTLFDHRSSLIAYVTKQMPLALQSTCDPADVVHDVYFEALRRADQFVAVDASSHSRWFMTIAKNRVLHLVRRQKASRRTPQRAYDDDSLTGLLGDVARYERTPSASAAAHETRFAVEQSVQRLAPAQALAIRLRFYEGLSHREVASRTGKTEAAARQLCHYALKALRKDLASALSLG